VRSIGILLLTFLLLALESPVLHRASVTHYAPDLVLLAVLFVGQTSRFESGILLCLLLGLLKDGFAPGSVPIGMYTEISVLAFLVSYQISKRLAYRGAITAMLVSIFFVVGTSIILLLLSLIFHKGFDRESVILGSMVPQALVTAPCAPVVFWLFDRLDRLTVRKRNTVHMG
jgi:rod shape-determining protein MreD